MADVGSSVVGFARGNCGSINAGLFVGMAGTAGSWQVPQTLNGPPIQVTPYVPEPGVPIITITPGTVDPTGTDGSGTGTGTGNGNTRASGNSGSDVLGTMLGTSWGSTAVANAEALGLNPSALAATCVIESGCGANPGSGDAQGVFQMFPAAYQEGLQTALAANPSLASQVVQGSGGMNDPTTEAIAASGYLLEAATSLESAGITNPTILDAHGYYNFGPSNAAALANAQDDQTMASVLYNLSPATLQQNGITPGETVGQWRTSVVNQIGNAANQPVLT